MTTTYVDWIPAAAAWVCGLGLALWVTSIWRRSVLRGNEVPDYDPFKKLVLFLLIGALPGVFQGMAFSPSDGVLTFASYVGGVGTGFTLGWIFTQGEGSVNAGIARQRYRLVDATPSNLEVYALVSLKGVKLAQSISNLPDAAFDEAYNQGAQEALPYLTSATADQRRLFIRVFAGDPISAIARIPARGRRKLRGNSPL